MEFALNKAEMKAYEEWKDHCAPPPTAIGGAHTFCFTLTSIGDMVKVKCYCGEEKDLTDYDSM